jgi:hypothetical protein
MAELKFYTSFTAANGATASRGEAGLFEDMARIRTGHIVDIRDNLSAHYVTANIATGDENSLRGAAAVRFEGSGYYHLADKGKPGVPNGAKFFVTVKEGEQAAIDLHAHMTGVSEGVTNPPQAVEQPGDSDFPPTENQPTEAKFDPADTNRDGVVSPKEQKRYDRQKGE